jgi:DNA repair exonuclease SbcCD nuclease subunit
LLDKIPQNRELQAFKKHYVKSVKDTGFKLYLCVGNHDLPATSYKPVYKYAINRHNATDPIFRSKWYGGKYKFKHNATDPIFRSKWYGGKYKFKHNGVTFLCLGAYPNDNKWLYNNLPKKGKPVIIWYHYNTSVTEPFSDFWSVEDKSKFFDTIDGHNILCICNGHWHSTNVGMYRDVYNVKGSSSKYAIIHIKDNKLEKVIFDNGLDENISSTDRLKKFEEWRVNNPDYDKQNLNTIIDEDKEN